MGHSGLVNWHRLERTLPWVKVNGQQHTYVYAFWLVDFGRLTRQDSGVEVLKQPGGHPDWFIHAQTADRVLDAFLNPDTWVSPNRGLVFDDASVARPLLASMLVGTSDGMYQTSQEGQLWWCDYGDLTWRGRVVVRHLNDLYERRAILLTFLDKPTDEDNGPRDPH